ncbi:MAG: hypothetical protein PUB39_05365 [Eubacteriales bacterium]|nr:hypothetical protein [Eubacteriales bacterium]
MTDIKLENRQVDSCDLLGDLPEDFPYKDIISEQHHVSSKRAHLTLHERAAQFSPFAALTGYGKAVEETIAQVMEENDK